MKNKLKEILYDQRMSVTQLSRETGIPRPSIYNIMKLGVLLKQSPYLQYAKRYILVQMTFMVGKKGKNMAKKKLRQSIIKRLYQFKPVLMTRN